MFIEQPPWFYRALFPGVTWRIPAEKKCVYLTFDDGPIPEVTPWVLDILDTYGIKATFFMVGDNVRKHPEVFQMVIDRGHRVGNHTFNHIQGIKLWTKNYLANVEKAAEYIPSTIKHAPVKSQIFIRSCGSLDILRIIYAVPTMPITGNNIPQGTLKFLGAFGRRFLKTSTSTCASI